MATTTKSEDLIAHLRATTMVVSVGAGGGLTLPEQIRQAAGIVEGDLVYVEIREDGAGGLQVQLRKIAPDQAWFWTPEWQAKEREADEDRAAGRVSRFTSEGELLTALQRWSNDADL